MCDTGISAAERDRREKFQSLERAFHECYPTKYTPYTIYRSKVQLNQYLSENLKIAIVS